MGGIDLVDCALSDLRPTIYGKKWYWPLLVNAFNLTFLYRWRLYQLFSNTKIPQIEFRRTIVTALLKTDTHRMDINSRSGPSNPVKIDKKIVVDLQ